MSAIDAHDVSSLRASARLELAGELDDDVEAAGLGGSGECYGERGPDGVEPLLPSSGGSCDAKPRVAWSRLARLPGALSALAPERARAKTERHAVPARLQ
jgi:hypothetical protein